MLTSLADRPYLNGNSAKESESKPMKDYNTKSMYQRLLNLQAYSIVKELDSFKSLRQSSQKELTLVDFGCSHGYNTIMLYRKILSDLSENKVNVDFKVYLNDLPSNDFDQVYKCLKDAEISYNYLPQFGKQAGNSVSTSVVGNSFYSRIMPQESIDLGTSLFTLHWLPQSLPLSKAILPHGNLVTASEATSYKEIASQALTSFLTERATEFKVGGLLFTIIIDFPELTQLINTRWESFVLDYNLKFEDFEDLVLPCYWRGAEEISHSIAQVDQYFKVVYNDVLPKCEIALDAESLNAGIYNSILYSMSKLKCFENEPDALDLTDRFVEVLFEGYTGLHEVCHLVVLERI